MKLPDRFKASTSGAAAGGMSYAQHCHDSQLNRDVLVKHLQDHTEHRRLVDEITALATIRSKHVVQIFDVINDKRGKLSMLVEEYLTGNDATALAPISDRSIFMRTAYAIACGLSDIHEAGIVHRDIKPQNMKFDADGCLKIFDFGLARSLGEDAATEGAVGTSGFMAPEICPLGWEDEVTFDESIDTYAFAASLLWLALERLPREMRKRVPTIPAEADFGGLPLALAPDVVKLLNSCLSESPGDRPKMSNVRDLLGSHILRDQHRAVLVANGERHILHKGRRRVAITIGTLGGFNLDYDGLGFSISSTTGDVYLNNVRVRPGQRLPGSCVVTVGAQELGPRRTHLTVDVSHPEVVL